MASEIETIADIEAEMRNWDTHSHLDSHAHDELCAYADRIEAAWKREAVTNCNGSGNAAAMREALEKTLDKLQEVTVAEEYDAFLMDDCVRYIRSSLSAPPRNCDRFADAMDMFRAYRELLKSGHGSSANPNWVSLGKWLLAPAEKGGAE